MDSGIRFMFQKPSKFFFCKHYLFLEILSYCQNCQHQDSASRTEDDSNGLFSVCAKSTGWNLVKAMLHLKSQQHYMLRLLILVIFCLDPTHVMGLYPDLLPTDYRKQLQYPNPLPGLSGAELEKAHLALIDYLTQVSTLISVFRAGLFKL